MIPQLRSTRLAAVLLLMIAGGCTESPGTPAPDLSIARDSRADLTRAPDRSTVGGEQRPLEQRAGDATSPPDLHLTDALVVKCKPRDQGGFICHTNLACKTLSECPTYAPVKCPGSWTCADVCIYECM